MTRTLLLNLINITQRNDNEQPNAPVLLLSGTLAKRTKPTLQPNFAKEPSIPRPTPTHGGQDSAAKMEDKLTGKINNETPTKCICHKGFSGYSSILARSNFRVGGQETAPQSLTAHTLIR